MTRAFIAFAVVLAAQQATAAPSKKSIEPDADKILRQMTDYLASLQSFHDNRVNRLNADLASAGDPRILRMKRSELASVQRNFDDRKAELEKARQIDIISHRVAAGILEVTQ